MEKGFYQPTATVLNTRLTTPATSVQSDWRESLPVLAGAAEANVRETVRACEAYFGFGARAVAIVSPGTTRASWPPPSSA